MHQKLLEFELMLCQKLSPLALMLQFALFVTFCGVTWASYICWQFCKALRRYLWRSKYDWCVTERKSYAKRGFIIYYVVSLTLTFDVSLEPLNLCFPLWKMKQNEKLTPHQHDLCIFETMLFRWCVFVQKRIKASAPSLPFSQCFSKTQT